jgi:hypothetical protein
MKTGPLRAEQLAKEVEHVQVEREVDYRRQVLRRHVCITTLSHQHVDRLRVSPTGWEQVCR